MPAKMFEGKIPTPNGLQELMFGFTKEIIKNQPENIIEFAAEHFEKLLLLREETRRAERVKKIPKKTLKMEKEEAVGEADDDTEPILTEIEHETSEKIITNKCLEASNNVSKYDRTVAAVMLIQKSFRSYKQRQLGNLQKPSACDELPHQRGQMETCDTTDSDETSTFSSAATKIQANVRGYLVRKSLAKNTSDATIAPSMSLDEGDTLKDIVEEKENLLLESGKKFEGEHDVYVDSIRSDNLEKINEEIETKSDDNIVDKMNKENIELEVNSVSQNTVTEDTENMLEDAEINNTQVNDIENGEVEILDQNKNINDEHKINMDDLSNDVKNIQQVVSADENKIIDADKNDDDENQENADVSNINSSNLEQLNMSTGGNVSVVEDENVDNSDVIKNHSNTSNSSIDLSDKNVEDAAVTIQHSYRVYRSRTLRREDAVQSTTSSEGTSVAANDRGDKEVSDDEDAENYAVRDYVAGDSKQGSEEKKTSSKENKMSLTQNAESSDASVARDNVAKGSATLVPGTALNNITEEDEEADTISTSATRDYVADNAIPSSGNAPSVEEDSIVEVKKVTLENINTAESQESIEKDTQLENTDRGLVDENQAKHVENDSDNKTHETEINNTENVDDETGIDSEKDYVEINAGKDNDSDDEELTGGKSFISRDYVSLENKEVIRQDAVQNIPIADKEKSETDNLKDENNKIKDYVDNSNEDETVKHNNISTESQASGSVDDKMNDVVSAAVESNEHSIRKRSAVSEIIHDENNEEELQEHGEESGKEENVQECKDTKIDSEQIEVTDDGNENKTVTEVNNDENQDQENDNDDSDDEVLKGGKIQGNRDYIGAGNVSSKNIEKLDVEDIPLETETKVENLNLVKDNDDDINVDHNTDLKLTDSADEIKNQGSDNEDTDEEVLTGSKIQENRNYVGAASVDVENTAKVDVENILEEKKISQLKTEPKIENEVSIEKDQNENLLDAATEIKEKEIGDEDTDDEILTGSKMNNNRDYVGTESVDIQNTTKVDDEDSSEKEKENPLETESQANSEVIDDKEDTEIVKKENFTEDVKENKNHGSEDEDADDVLTRNQINGVPLNTNSATIENKDLSLSESIVDSDTGNQHINKEVNVKEDLTEESVTDNEKQETDSEDADDEVLTGSKVQASRDYISGSSDVDKDEDDKVVKKEDLIKHSIQENHNEDSNDKVSDNEILTGDKLQVDKDYLDVTDSNTENTTNIKGEETLEKKELSLIDSELQLDSESHDVVKDEDAKIEENKGEHNFEEDQDTDNKDSDEEILTGSKIQVNRDYLGVTDTNTENIPKDGAEDILENKYLSSPDKKAVSEIGNEEKNTNILQDLNHNNESSTTEDASQNELKEMNDKLTDNAVHESDDGEFNGNPIELSENYVTKELVDEDNSIKQNELELVNSENASNLESIGDDECNETKTVEDGKANMGQNENDHATKTDEEIDIERNDTESQDFTNETENVENKDESNTHIKEPSPSENKDISNEDTVKKTNEVNEPMQAINIVKENYEPEVQETVEKKVKVDENDNETNEENESDDEELKGGNSEVNRDYVAAVNKDVPTVETNEGDKPAVAVEPENKINTIIEEENSKSDVDENQKEDESKKDNNVVHIKSEENAEGRSSAVDEDDNDKDIEPNNSTSQDDNIVKDSHVKDDKDEEELYGGHQILQRDYIAPLLTAPPANNNSNDINTNKDQSMLPETANSTKENIVENPQFENHAIEKNHVDEKHTSGTDVENHNSENHLLENNTDEKDIVNVTRNNESDSENLESRTINPHDTMTISNHIENDDVINPGNEIGTVENHEISENIEDSVINNLTHTNSLQKNEINEDNDDHDNDETENLFSLDSLNENPVNENSINEDYLQDERRTSFSSNDLGDGNHSHENVDKKNREQNDSDEEELIGGHNYVNRDYVVVKALTSNSTEERLKHVEDQIEKDDLETKVPSSNEKNKMNFEEDGIENKENENKSKEEIIENSKDKVTNDDKNVDVLSPTSEEKQNNFESILKRDYFAKLGTLKKSLSDTSDKMSKNIEINDEKMIIKSINSEIENKIVNLTDRKNIKGENVKLDLKDSSDQEKESADGTTQDLSHEHGMTSPRQSGSAQASDLTEETSTRPTPTPPPRISRDSAETSMNELNAVSTKQTDVGDSSENKTAAKLTQNSETFVEAAKDFGEKLVNTQELSATKENSVDLLQESAKIDPKTTPADQADQKLEHGLQKAEKIGQKVSEIDQNFTNLRDSDSQDDMNSKENAAAKIQAGFRGYKVRKQMRRDQELVTDQYKKALKRNGSLEERSATKIQAGIRGFLVRRKHNKAKEAATKIQASFRGFKTRKAMKKNGEV